MKTLLIDNYDSYTFILADYLWEVNGQKPIIVKNDLFSVGELKDLEFDNVVISPGPGRPDVRADFGVCMDLVRAMKTIPILGVCLGHQGLAACFGAKVALAPRVMHGKVSRVVHQGTGLFAGIPSPFHAVRYHSLVVDERDLPETVEVTARSEDDGLVMGLCIKDRPFFGVQFHPESVGTEHGRQLLANFHALTREAQSRRSPRVPGAKSPGIQVRELPWIDAERAFAGLYADAPYAFWLDSSSGGEARFSFMGSASEAIESVGRTVVRRNVSPSGDLVTVRLVEDSPFSVLREELERFAPAPLDLPFDLTGGLVGYLGYELKEHLGFGPSRGTPRALPDSVMMIARRVLVFDAVSRTVHACALEDDAASASRWMGDVAARWAAVPPLEEVTVERVPDDVVERIPLAQNLGREEYLAHVASLLERIREGETYEACLTNEFRLRETVDPFLLYRILRQTNPAPFSAYLRLPDGAVLSSSPERFLKVDRARVVHSEPMKGTRPRGQTPEETCAQRRDLETSAKDRSELLMIVDLVRNDLARVCRQGSIVVEDLARVTEHATVLQQSAVVRGTLAETRDALDAVEACFPGGSITGAPKHRTISLLEELENQRRGIYTGSIGYLAYNGTMDLNIAIRTLVVDRDGISFGAGGAVVAESTPQGEYEETLVKRQALLAAVYLALYGRQGAQGD
jgi:para-aminobenzoate synthetase